MCLKTVPYFGGGLWQILMCARSSMYMWRLLDLRIFNHQGHLIGRLIPLDLSTLIADEGIVVRHSCGKNVITGPEMSLGDVQHYVAAEASYNKGSMVSKGTYGLRLHIFHGVTVCFASAARDYEANLSCKSWVVKYLNKHVLI